MVRLPVVSGKEAIRAFEKLGWIVHRSESSHISMHKKGSPLLLTVPDHDELAKGTLRSLIRLAGVSVEEFVSALRK